MGSFAKMFEPIISDIDKFEGKLAEKEANLKACMIALEDRNKELGAREMAVSRREREVFAVRQIAANRKAEVLAAQDSANKAHERRKKAEADLRVALQNNATLREALAAVLPAKLPSEEVANVKTE